MIRSSVSDTHSMFHRNIGPSSYFLGRGLRLTLSGAHRLNRLNWCLGYHSFSVAEFHEAEVSIPPNLHEIDVENLELRGDDSEVDELQQWPHFHIRLEGWPQFLTKLIFCALKGFPLALGGEDVKTGNWYKAEESLREKQLLSDALHGVSRGEKRNEFRVSVVESRAVGEKPIRHEVHSSTYIVRCLTLI